MSLGRAPKRRPPPFCRRQPSVTAPQRDVTAITGVICDVVHAADAAAQPRCPDIRFNTSVWPLELRRSLFTACYHRFINIGESASEPQLLQKLTSPFEVLTSRLGGRGSVGRCGGWSAGAAGPRPGVIHHPAGRGGSDGPAATPIPVGIPGSQLCPHGVCGAGPAGVTTLLTFPASRAASPHWKRCGAFSSYAWRRTINMLYMVLPELAGYQCQKIRQLAKYKCMVTPDSRALSDDGKA